MLSIHQKHLHIMYSL